MKWKPLSLESTLIFKGIAILMIATHNFMHLFPFPKENEFDFLLERSTSLLHLLWTEPENSLRVLFSFFGHFGVQVFMLLSAYGLTKKYLDSKPDYWRFLWQRAVKIYPAFIIAIVIWLALEGFYSHGLFGPFKMLSMHYEAILLKLTLISNFIPEKAQDPIGPWWFIPFIFQFYFIFPFLLKAYNRWQEIGFIALAVFSFVLSDVLHGEIHGVNIYYTILPYLPVLCLGIYLAKNDANGLSISTTLIVLASILFILGNINQHLWVTTHLSFIIVFMVLLNYVIPKIKNNTRKALIFTGKISMSLFLVNGFLRFPMARWAIAYDNWLITIALCLVFLLIAFFVAIVLDKIESVTMKWLKDFVKARQDKKSERTA